MAKKTISERIISVENEIRNIKCKQATKSDSYIFYVKSSGDIFNQISNRSWKKRFIFEPYSAKYGEYVCQFYAVGWGRKSISYGPVPSKYNQAIVYVSGWSEETYVEGLDYVYVYVYSNVDGILKMEDV